VLVARRDPLALAGAIEGLLADPRRRRELGAAGRERRRAEFDQGVMVARIEALYEQLYAARGAGSAVLA
jgi:glycosyltransferase involved in cell wall biosynthesis